MRLIILASASETRAKILTEAGVEFKQSPVEFDEDSLALKYTSARSFVYHVTKGKLQKAIEKLGLNEPLLVADTVVAVGENILRKAKNEEEAKKILELQSGSKVSILTCTAYKSKKIEFIDISVTSYIFDIFDEKELQEYLKSGDWRGKAGACMVEGFCKKYIKEVNGFESCARGLTIEKLIPFIKLDENH